MGNLTDAEYKAKMARLARAVDKDGNHVIEEKPKVNAFAWTGAAWECAPQFRDSHVHMQVLHYLAKCADNTTGESRPAYETIMHYAGTTNRNLVADALNRLVMVGILKKRKRLNDSTVYTLNLPRMLELRKPVLRDYEKDVITRMNTLVIQPAAENALTQDAILAMNDDEYIYEVMYWYLQLWGSGEHAEAHPNVKVDTWVTWQNFLYGITENNVIGYRQIRSSYFAMLGQDEPEIAPLTLATFCLYCCLPHIGGCDRARLKEIRDMERCEKCNYLLDSRREHECSVQKSSKAANAKKELLTDVRPLTYKSNDTAASTLTVHLFEALGSASWHRDGMSGWEYQFALYITRTNEASKLDKLIAEIADGQDHDNCAGNYQSGLSCWYTILRNSDDPCKELLDRVDHIREGLQHWKDWDAKEAAGEVLCEDCDRWVPEVEQEAHRATCAKCQMYCAEHEFDTGDAVAVPPVDVPLLSAVAARQAELDAIFE